MPERPDKITVQKVTKQYDKGVAISPLSFSVKKGELVALIGPSGAGKTTLMNLLAGFQQADTGLILFDGKAIESIGNHKEKAKNIGMIRQQYDLIGQLPVIHNVLVGRLADWGLLKSLFSLFIPQDKDVAISALRRVGILDKIYERTSSLSGGEQQRVAIARLIVQDPEIILADEPVASLDPTRARDVLELFRKIALDGEKTLIASLHSVEYAKEYFDRLIGLKDGEIYFDLPTEAVTNSHISSLYHFKEQL